MSYAVRDFFLNGGSQAVVVRLFNLNTRAALAAKDVVNALPSDTNSDLAALQSSATTAANEKNGLDKVASQKVVDAITKALKNNARLSAM